MQRPDASPQPAAAMSHPIARLPYRAPRLDRLGAVAELTAAVSKMGNMDGFMGFRTG